MAPYLYDDLMEVVKSLMRRCVKPEVIEKAATAAQLMKIMSWQEILGVI